MYLYCFKFFIFPKIGSFVFLIFENWFLLVEYMDLIFFYIYFFFRMGFCFLLFVRCRFVTKMINDFKFIITYLPHEAVAEVSKDKEPIGRECAEFNWFQSQLMSGSNQLRVK